MTRLIQIKKGNVRRVALVDEPYVRLLDNCSSVYELAHIAIAARMKLSEVARQRARLEASTTTRSTMAVPNGGCCRPLTTLRIPHAA